MSTRAGACGDEQGHHAQRVQPPWRDVSHRPQHLRPMGWQVRSNVTEGGLPVTARGLPGAGAAKEASETSGNAAAERTCSRPVAQMKTTVSSLESPGEMKASGRSPRLESTSRVCHARVAHVAHAPASRRHGAGASHLWRLE